MPSQMPIFALDRCIVMIQVAPPTASELAEASALVDEMHRDGRPLSVLVVVDTSMPMLDSSTRARLQQFAKKAGSKCTAIQIALRGTGFWAAAMRGIATVLAAGSATKMGVSTSESEALRALSRDGAQGLPDEATLMAALAKHGLSA